MSQHEIRPITKEDVESFHSCLDAVARERKFLGLIMALPLEKTRNWLLAGMEEGEIRLVALDGSQVIGWCDIETSQREGFTHTGKLGMGILREHRGQGLGSRLLEEILAVTKERGLERVELDVDASNTPAIKLYEKFDFEIEGRKRKARKIDGVRRHHRDGNTHRSTIDLTFSIFYPQKCFGFCAGSSILIKKLPNRRNS